MPPRPPTSPWTSIVVPFPDAPPPLEAFRRLRHRPRVAFRWAAGGPADLARWSFLASDPVERRSSVRGGTRGRSDPFGALAARAPRAVLRVGPRIPFAGGWFGSFGYELRSAVEATPPSRPAPDGFPALSFARYDAVLAWEHPTGRAWLAGTAPTRRGARAAIARLRERLGAAPRPAETEAPPGGGDAVLACLPPARYRRLVAEVQRRIRRGDLFQANLSQRFEGTTSLPAATLFERVVRRSPVPFATYLDVGGGRAILCASPERFLALHGDRAETRPMKGTRPRGADRAGDRLRRRELEASEKDRAELAMIVDLSRNDLGRVCRPGSVRVEKARRLERYATVHQAVGVVTGRLARGRTGLDLVRAAFPPGSVTGAPKVEAMVAIDALEAQGRGPYCGAIGWIDEGGDLDLAVAIRTICVSGGRLSYRVGGGITLGSDPEEERVETLDKGRALAEAVLGVGLGAREEIAFARSRGGQAPRKPARRAVPSGPPFEAVTESPIPSQPLGGRP